MTAKEWKLSKDPKAMLRFLTSIVERRILVLVSCEVAQWAVVRFADEETAGLSLTCLAITRAWARGEASIEQVKEAAYAATYAAHAAYAANATFAAAYAAAYAATYAANAAASVATFAAAANATNAATYAAYAATNAATYAARDEANKRLAALIRKVMPYPKRDVEYVVVWHEPSVSNPTRVTIRSEHAVRKAS